MLRTATLLAALALLTLLLPGCTTMAAPFETQASINMAMANAEGAEDWRYQGPMNTEEYDQIVENPFVKATEHPLSTFSIDVDTASYSNVRRFLNDGTRPPKDAGEIGAGHTVTALYEITSPEHLPETGTVDDLRYQTGREATAAAESPELLTLKVRYKQPRGDESYPLIVAVPDPGEVPAGTASESFRFSAAVAAFGLLLRDSEYKGSASYPLVQKYAEGAIGQDPHGYRAEFVRLVSLAQDM